MNKEVSKCLFSICFVAGFTVFPGCMKEANLPSLTTTEVSNITDVSASSGGNITDNGGANVDLRGVCWGTGNNPTIKDSKTYYHIGNESFICPVTRLTPDTYYHVRAFAMNSAGVAYGNEVHFTTTPIVWAKVTTIIDPAFIIDNTADAGGIVTDDGGHPVTERGVCWAKTPDPTIKNQSISCGIDTGRYSCFIRELQPGTIYHVRAYAITMAGVVYGADRQFTTHTLPPVETAPVTELSRTTATVGGTLRLNDFARIDCGICYGTKPSPVIYGYDGANWILDGSDWVYFIGFDSPGTGGEFKVNLTELNPGTLYYARMFVRLYKNLSYPYTYLWLPHLTVYGNEVTFTTSR
jgi:hypothetical protein